MYQKKKLWQRTLFYCIFLSLCFGSHGSAHAIEYHGSLIEQTLSERGFDTDAINLAQSMSFLNDLGQQSLGSDFEGRVNDIFVWNGATRSAQFADRTHFDDKCNYTDLKIEWERLEANTYKAVKTAESKGDIPGFLTVMGISLHNVHDFYAHSNWAELSEEGIWQNSRSPSPSPVDATWFDVPEDLKEKTMLYTTCEKSHDEINKDYAGRPHFETSYREAYYASEQWVEQIRHWVSDDFWREAQQYQGTPENCINVPTVNNQGVEIAKPPSFVWERIRRLCWYTGIWNDHAEVSGGMKWDSIRMELLFESIPACYYSLYDEYIPLIAADQQLVSSDSFPHFYSKVAPKKWLKIQTNRVAQTDCDDIDIDPGAEEADFYSMIQVNSIGYIEAPVFDEDEIKPKNWVTLVPLTEINPITYIRYDIWDDDDVLFSVKGEDDHCDIYSGEGEKSWTYYGSTEDLENLNVFTHGDRGYKQYCFFVCWGCYQTIGDGDEAIAEFDISLSQPQHVYSEADRDRAPSVPDDPVLILTANPYTVFLPNNMSFEGELFNYSKTTLKKIILRKGHYSPTLGVVKGDQIITSGWVDDEVLGTITMNSYGGKYSFSHAPSGNSSYRAYAEDQNGHKIAASNIVNILVLDPQGKTESGSEACDDNNKCTVNDRFTERICTGDPLPCDDGNPDTFDSCNPSTGCVFTRLDKSPLDNTPCDDGNSCTVNDYYIGGICSGGELQKCDDGSPDTLDSCNPARGCVFTRIDHIPEDQTSCNDGNLCTVNDYYRGGVCTSGKPLDCDDQNLLTTDSCDPKKGCVFTAASTRSPCTAPCECLYEYEAKRKFSFYEKCSENPCFVDTSQKSLMSAKYCFRPA